MASGGEADVFRVGKWALKIYHDPSQMIPAAKLDELKRITHTNVLTPHALVYKAKTRQTIGFTMPFAQDAIPLVRLFSRTFKRQHGIRPHDTQRLVGEIRQSLAAIHRANCLVVDLNEMNLMVRPNFHTPIFIDCDSYQTPSYPATALSESVRDPRAGPGRFSRQSDWFAFAVIAFQLYIGMHPFKGRHPDYPPNAWRQRMEDGVSAFALEARLPPSCEDLGVIPPNLCTWMQAVFQQGERSPPPLPMPAFEPKFAAVHVSPESSGSLAIQRFISYPEPIVNVFPIYDDAYVVTHHGIYRNRESLVRGIEGPGAMVVLSDRGTPLFARLEGRGVNRRLLVRTMKGRLVDQIPARACFWRDGLFSLDTQRLVAHDFSEWGGRLFRKARVLGQVNNALARAYDGLVLQNLLGKTWILAPTGRQTLLKPLPELDGFRVVDAKMEGHACVFIAEKGGTYHQILLLFRADESGYVIGINPTDFAVPNFAVLANRIVALIGADQRLALFADGGRHVRHEAPRLDAAAKLFTLGQKVCLASGSSLYRLTTEALTPIGPD